MPETKNAERKNPDELSKELTATEILYLLGETLLMEIDEQVEIEYADCDQPHHLVFKMKNGRIMTVLVMDIIPAKK